jgi:hypothetical protein
MTKIKRSYTIDLDLDNAIGRLASRLGQSNSQLIGNILRDDPEMKQLLKQIHTMKEMPDHMPELNGEITV